MGWIERMRELGEAFRASIPSGQVADAGGLERADVPGASRKGRSSAAQRVVSERSVDNFKGKGSRFARSLLSVDHPDHF